MQDLIKKILVTEPDQRYNINQIRDHIWFSLNQPIQTSEGILIGYTHIPIEKAILDMMKQFGFEPEYVQKCLDANKHNHVTTTYYLFLKRLKKEGKLKCEYETTKLQNLSSDRKQFSAQRRVEYEASVLDSIAKERKDKNNSALAHHFDNHKLDDNSKYLDTMKDVLQSQNDIDETKREINISYMNPLSPKDDQSYTEGQDANESIGKFFKLINIIAIQ